jgi:hypothetical protein
MAQQWKECIIVPIYENDKTDYSNYRGILQLPTAYKMLSSILLSRLIPYIEEITGDFNVKHHLLTRYSAIFRY